MADSDYAVDPRPFCEIVHMLLRHDGEEEVEEDRIPRAYGWLQDRQRVLQTVSSPAEYRVLKALYAAWDGSGRRVAASREDLDKLIHTQQKVKLVFDVLEEYDRHVETLTLQGVGSLETSLALRIQHFEVSRSVKTYEMAKIIAVGAYEFDKKTRYEGPRGAIQYLMKRLQGGFLVDDQKAQGGVLSEALPGVKSRFEIAVEERENHRLFIPTGIKAIDNTIGGLRRKDVNGILGYTGQKKTWCARSIAFQAAMSGHRVLHIPLESDCEEEQNVYAVMYAQTRRLCETDSTVSKRNLERGLISEGDAKRLFAVVREFEGREARNLIIRRPSGTTWQDVQAMIERESVEAPIDLVVIDYLTLLGTPGTRDEIADKTQIIKDAKQFAMTANNGRGLCILTPVQGNRQGYEEAVSNNGQWFANRIFKYSELDKSLDNIFYVFTSDELANEDKLIVGTCKTRRDAVVPPTFVPVHPLSGAVGVSPQQIAAPSWSPSLPTGLKKPRMWDTRSLSELDEAACAHRTDGAA